MKPAAFKATPKLGVGASRALLKAVGGVTLTEERRREMVKQLGDKVEQSRVQLRGVRQDALKEAKKMKDAKELSEDDVKRIESGIDDDMKKYQAKIDAAFAAKEKELMTV